MGCYIHYDVIFRIIVNETAKIIDYSSKFI